MFKSMRTKFLAMFVAGVMLTLSIAMVVSYAKVNTVYMNINDRITKAEFDQMSGDIIKLLQETDLLANQLLLSREAFRQLVRYQNLSVAERSAAVNELSYETVQITTHYDHVDSVYIHVNREWFLAMSQKHTRQFFDAKPEWPAPAVLAVLEQAQPTLQVAGGFSTVDFPLSMDPTPYLMLYREIINARGTSVIVINLKESALFEIYSGYLKDGLRSVRILDREGRIVSSVDKTELGAWLEEVKGMDLSREGTLSTRDTVTNFTPVGDTGLVIVSTLPVAVYTSQLTSIRNTLLVIYAVSMLATSLVFSGWINRRLKPLKALNQGMEQAGRGNYRCALPVTGNDELSELTVHFNNMLTALEELDQKNREAALEMREKELTALRNEINPHFLYNTLNTVKCMADMEGNKDISRCVVALGGIIAPLYKQKSSAWSLREELKLVEKYLEIMNIRYGDGIFCEMRVPDNFLDVRIMRFLLQPIVENSILHGFENRGYAGRIIIAVERRDKDICIIVEDDGEGISVENLQKLNRELQMGRENGGVGMLNVSRRITLRHGPEYGIHLEAAPSGGLITYITLPGKWVGEA